MGGVNFDVAYEYIVGGSSSSPIVTRIVKNTENMEADMTLIDRNENNETIIELRKDNSGNFVIRATVDTNKEIMDYAKRLFNIIKARTIKLVFTEDGDDTKSMFVEY